MKQPELLREQRSSFHSIIYPMKCVGKRLNKGGKITDLPYFIKWFTILLHITYLILYLRLLATFLVTTCETQMISKLLVPELASTITLFCPQQLETGTVYPKKQNNPTLSILSNFSSLRANQRCLTTIILVAEKPRFFILVFALTVHSSLNLDLFVKNITESPLCRCGSIGNAQNFFFHCKYFELQRRELLNAISPYVNPSLKLLLTGDSTLSPQINNEITLKVHKYIIDMHRFWNSNRYVLNHMRLVLCQHVSAPDNQCPVSLSLQMLMLIFTFFPSFLFCSVDVYIYKVLVIIVMSNCLHCINARNMSFTQHVCSCTYI